MIRLMESDALHDLFAGLGPVTIRRMFGGKGIYHNGVIIAVELRGELMLKADAQSAPEFEQVGCTQWTYVGSRHGKTVAMPYWSVPDGAMDDPDEMAPWARLAYEAAVRTSA
jgi:DNA transformation protein